jgi:hypothetical protein
MGFHVPEVVWVVERDKEFAKLTLLPNGVLEVVLLTGSEFFSTVFVQEPTGSYQGL